MSSQPIELDVFGRRVLVVRSEDAWRAYYLGNEGKRRPAKDIVLPSTLDESEVVQYVADLCHEWASERYPDVRRVKG